MKNLKKPQLPNISQKKRSLLPVDGSRRKGESMPTLEERKAESARKRRIVIQMYRRGSSKEEIIEATGYKIPTIDRILRDSGVIQRQYVRDYANDICRMHKKGHTPAEIADAIGFSAQNVRMWMAENGLYFPIRRKTAHEEEQTAAMVFRIAADKRRIRKEVIRGKSYTDVTDYFAGV